MELNSLMEMIVYPQTGSSPHSREDESFFLALRLIIQLHRPPITDADIQETIALPPQYGLTILPPDSAID